MAKLASLEGLLTGGHHVEDVLRERLTTPVTGPSRLGWHAVGHFMRCPRLAYWGLVQGLRPRKPRPGIDVGILMHTSRELHYSSGGTRTFEAIQACQDACPEAAQEAHRLLSAYIAKYSEVEANTWDVRGIEHAAEVWRTAKPIFGGRAVRFPISCRYDLIVRKREPGSPTLPAGPCPDGVLIDEMKNLSQLRREAIAGYGMDGQLLAQALLWREANLNAVFGPLNGFCVNIIVKTKVPRLERLETRISDAEVATYAQYVYPWAAELWKRLRSPDAYPVEAWPMNYAGCQGRYLCEFFDLCESGGTLTELYEVTPAHAERAAARDAPEVKVKRPRKPRKPRSSTGGKRAGLARDGEAYEVERRAAAAQGVCATCYPHSQHAPGACEYCACGREAFVSQWTGTRCSNCGEPQYTTPSGDTCVNGHGGAPPLALDEVPVAAAQAPVVPVPLRVTLHDHCPGCGVVFDGDREYVDGDGTCTTCHAGVVPACPQCRAIFGGVAPAPWIQDDGRCPRCGNVIAMVALRSVEGRWSRPSTPQPATPARRARLAQ